MAWISELAKRRIRIAQRLTLWAGQAHRAGKVERANKLSRMAAQQMEKAYQLEMSYRSSVA